ncbi:restriction endonuclease [Streptomyces sp. NPDC093071]|uniref:restriction endonuclease n=1 Tax=Streptomyces sp. NPDC093071 TaxID=3366022 RepID=UPI0037FC8116
MLGSRKNRVLIAVLESDNNKRGDLFGRATQDLFHALGYEDFTTNVHKAGREIDIKGKHRTEKRTLIAECKATKSAVGGADLNKFAGAVQAEKARDPVASAYYVSLGGFTSPALEQEKEVGHRMTLLDGPKIVDELVRGRVIVDRSVAAVVAGTCEGLPAGAKLAEKSALLIHEVGWIWSFFFKVGGKYSFFTLVHADGHGLHQDLSRTIIDADSRSSNLFRGLVYVGPRNFEDLSKNDEAKEEYLSYLEREFGRITLEGLPADQEVGSKAIRLESLYVPLHLNPIPRQEKVMEVDQEKGERIAQPGTEAPRKKVSEILSSTKHIAILAAPGGGKTTLLKRIALAYAYSDRRDEVSDELPAEDWFPLFIRCRQLGSGVRNPITEIIEGIPRQAERPDLAESFKQIATAELKSGKALLLVDGLDEISDSSDRAAFAAQLRTFIGTYPATRVVITSREAGFRVVSGAMSTVCSLYRIADLSNSDIHTLCRTWHHAVVGGSTESANKLAKSIVSKPRVRELAINPLLLTTLLLVQRWLGELPQKRSVLYDKAIEVLLMTWNREGHDPIDRDEAIPQLAYAAFTMMKEKKQAISAKGLKDLFDEARAAMPEVLGYARVSSTDLIDRVEERSSLLVQSGHIVEDGQLRPLYEFKHLTFQEYLTAQACVESWNPNRDKTDDYSEILRPYLNDESWSEVVPLAAVLAGHREAKKVVTRLIECMNDLDQQSPDSSRFPASWGSPVYSNLAQCLIDEVQIMPGLVQESIDCLIKASGPREDELIIDLCQGKFAEEIPGVAWRGYSRLDESALHYGSSLATYTLWTSQHKLPIVETLSQLLSSKDEREAVTGAAAVMALSFMKQQASREKRPTTKLFQLDLHASLTVQDFSTLKSLLREGLARHSQSQPFRMMATWTLCWLASLATWSDEEISQAIEYLLEYWQGCPHAEGKRVAAWSIWALPLASPDHSISISNPRQVRSFFKQEAARERKSQRFYVNDVGRASVIISYYAGWKIDYPTSDGKLHDGDILGRQWSEKLARIRASRPN